MEQIVRSVKQSLTLQPIPLPHLCREGGASNLVFRPLCIGIPEVNVQVLEAILVHQRPACDVDVVFGSLLHLEDHALPSVEQRPRDLQEDKASVRERIAVT